MTYTKESTKTYTFGKISFAVKNYRGMYSLSESVKEQIKSLSSEDARVCNKAAWKQSSECIKVSNYSCNWSVPGNTNTYEENSSHARVAEQVAKASYKNFMGFN